MRSRHLSLSVSLIIVLGLAQACCAQQLTPSKSLPLKTQIAPSQDRLHLLPILAIGGVLTAVAWPNDRSVQKEAHDSPLLDIGGSDVGDIYGSGYSLLALSAGTWGIGQITGDAYTRQTARLMFEGLAIDGALVFGAKHLAGRTRPDGSDRLSFPSGHTSGAFTFATILSRRYGWRLGAVGYTLATMTAGARLEDNRHYLSDVIAGATIGIVVGRWVTRNQTHNAHLPHLVVNSRGVGLALSF